MATIDDIWPNLKQETRLWLVTNNGDAVPDEIVAELVSAGGSVMSDGSFGEDGPTGFFLNGETVDWIEEIANGE